MIREKRNLNQSPRTLLINQPLTVMKRKNMANSLLKQERAPTLFFTFIIILHLDCSQYILNSFLYK